MRNDEKSGTTVQNSLATKNDNLTNQKNDLMPDVFWTYKKVGGVELKLSVFLPDDYNASDSFPCILFYHGGSWVSGEASWHYPDCSYWSKRGMVAVSVDYRLRDRDKVQVPLECIKDAMAAINFLRKNAGELKIDPKRIVAAGASAGGQLAAATAMVSSKEISDDRDIYVNSTISCRPDAVILFNPSSIGGQSYIPVFNPPSHVTEELPPFIIFSGDNDRIVKVQDMINLHNSLVGSGNISQLYIAKGGSHGFCNGRNKSNQFYYWYLELADKFLVENKIISGYSCVKRPSNVKALGSNDYDEYL